MAWRLRLGPSTSLRTALRVANNPGRRKAFAIKNSWDLQSLEEEHYGLLIPFVFFHARTWLPIGNAAEARRHARWATFRRILVREALRRIEPRTLEVARTFKPGLRLAIYRLIADDPTGRVRQAALTCPGLAISAASLLQTPSARAQARNILAGIVAGHRLPVLLALAARATVQRDHLGEHCQSPGARRIQRAPRAERDRAIEVRRLLLSRAGARVDHADLMGVLPTSIVPEDLPRHPAELARWFAVMAKAALVVDDIPEPTLREGLSAFCAANTKLLARRCPSRIADSESCLAIDGPTLITLLQLLLRYARATGKAPHRERDARKYLASAEAWRRLRLADTAAGRLGSFLRRVADFDLGEVTAIRFLTSVASVDSMAGIALPAGPAERVSMPGIELRHLDTPEALAHEGARMGHCVATWLPQALSGEAAIYSGVVAGQALTVAVGREAGGRLVLRDARREGNVPPTAAQTVALTRWVAESGAAGEGGSGQTRAF